MSRSETASSSAPASYFVCAAARARCARSDGSDVSPTALSWNAAAAASLHVHRRARPRVRAPWRRPHRRPRSRRRGARPGDRDRPRIGGVGQRPVRLPPFARRCTAVKGRAHQRMTKPHPAVHVDQPVGLRGLERPGVDRESLRGPPQQRWIASWLSRRHEQQPPSVLRQRLEAPREAALDPSGQRQRAGQPEAARQLPCAEPPRELQQRQGIPPRLNDDLFGDPPVQTTRNDRGQEGTRIGIPEPLERQLRQTRERVAWLTRSEQHHHRLRQHPPRHERQRLRRRLVQPLRIVNDAQKRPLLRHLRQQAQHRQTNQEPVGHRTGAQPKRVSSASRCGPGTRSSRSSIGAHS